MDESSNSLMSYGGVLICLLYATRCSIMECQSHTGENQCADIWRDVSDAYLAHMSIVNIGANTFECVIFPK